MKSFALMAAALALGLTLATGDADAARRLGGGKSLGMQREAVTAPKPAAPPAAAPSQATSPSPAAAPQTQPRRSWMGPLAGLAAGLGLAALASHFGFGEGLANLLLIGLLVMAAIAVFRLFMRRRSPPPQSGLQYAGAGYGPGSDTVRDYQPASAAGAASTSGHTGRIPADFDIDGFVRNAKVNFIRLQAANDSGNLDDLREFMTPEMFSEIRMDLMERGQAGQQTDVVKLDADVLDVAEEDERYVASVRFHGLIREAGEAAAAPFDEVWHLVKPRNGGRGWVVAGIQQTQ